MSQGGATSSALRLSVCHAMSRELLNGVLVIVVRGDLRRARSRLVPALAWTNRANQRMRRDRAVTAATAALINATLVTRPGRARLSAPGSCGG
eukprot:6380934-Prymnesium_polylepis.2